MLSFGFCSMFVNLIDVGSMLKIACLNFIEFVAMSKYFILTLNPHYQTKFLILIPLNSKPFNEMYTFICNLVAK